MSAPDPVPLLAELVRRESVSGGEARLVSFLAGWFEERGLPATIQGRNLVARAGDPGGPRLLWNAHLDTVPAGPGWTRDPLGAEISGDRLYGLGASDNKASAAAMASAMVALAAEELPGEVLFAATADEETGGEGLEWLLPRLSRIDQALLSEPTDFRVAIAQRGLVRLTARTLGRSAHAARPREGRNAIDLAVMDLCRLKAIDLSGSHPLLPEATLEITLIEGGTAPNVLPGEVTFTLDGRPTPARDNDYYEKEIRKALRSSEIVALKRRMGPVTCPADSAVVRAALRATGTAEPVALGGISDLYHVRDLPAAVVGPGTPDQSHRADESVPVAAVRRAVTVYREIARETLREIAS